MWRGWTLALVLAGLTGCGGGQKEGGSPGAQKTPAPAAEKPKTPLIPKAEVADWCKEHGVPESVCTRCNEKLTDGFKKKGDWCEKHTVPKSQCFDCDPGLKAKFESLRPK
jgi:hypothetical protein